MLPNELPTDVTDRIYSAPFENRLSQNDVKTLLAHFWPAIEVHIREQVAQEIETHPGPIPYRPELDEDGGFWWDSRDRDAAARIARTEASQ